MTYGIVLAVVAVDALLPFVQAEAVVITAGVLAAQGDLVIWLVLAAAALGGFLGDNASYLLGRRVGCRVVERFFRRGAPQATTRTGPSGSTAARRAVDCRRALPPDRLVDSHII